MYKKLPEDKLKNPVIIKKIDIEKKKRKEIIKKVKMNPFLKWLYMRNL
jgi:hypothetical protein